jgi:archaellum component FlaC
MSHTQRLMRQTARRQFLAALGRRWHLAAIGSAGLYLALLFASRLLGLLPDVFTPWTLAAIPAAGLLGALATTRRPAVPDTARLIDTRSSSKDLFLTAALSAETAGEFRPIVLEQAEHRASSLEAAKIVPFHWQRGLGQVAAALLVLAIGARLLPQFDPLGKNEQRRKSTQQEEKLREAKKATALRSEQLAADSTRQAEQVRQALAELDKTFKEAQPKQPEPTLQRLAEQQRELGELWRKVSNEIPRFDKAAQSFGATDPKKLQQWREELKRGDITSLKKELAGLRDQLRKLDGMPDSAEKRAAREQLAQQLNDLAQAMKQEMNSPGMNAALQRALDQLGQMSKDGLQGASDSLQLSEQELEQLAQAMKDARSLEDALKNLQMARQLCQSGKLAGGECKDCKGMGDYAALFSAKMAELGQPLAQGGSGMGPGIGNGARRPEDESAQTNFKTEKSPSQLNAGKLLLEWKTKEVGETGARTEEYREGLQRVKQGVSEAIQQEQVPPGYHEAIKKYFDALPAK